MGFNNDMNLKEISYSGIRPCFNFIDHVCPISKGSRFPYFFLKAPFINHKLLFHLQLNSLSLIIQGHIYKAPSHIHWHNLPLIGLFQNIFAHDG